MAVKLKNKCFLIQTDIFIGQFCTLDLKNDVSNDIRISTKFVTGTYVD